MDFYLSQDEKNKYMLERKEWAAIYKVSVSTVITAEKKLELLADAQDKLEALKKL